LERARFVENYDENESEVLDDDDDDDDENNITSRPSIDETIENLSKDIERLNDLHVSLTSPLLDLDFDTRDSQMHALQDMNPHQYFANCIRERFPSASLILTDHLGKANLQRCQLLQDMREKQHNQVSEEAILVSIHDNSSKPPISQFFPDSGYASIAATLPVKNSTAQSAYAQSTVSSKVSSLAEDGRSKYPLLSEEAKAGTPFKCAACGRNIIARRNHEYR
jgi:hypothetical protein